jgi:hypothetical protein
VGLEAEADDGDDDAALRCVTLGTLREARWPPVKCRATHANRVPAMATAMQRLADLQYELVLQY